MSDSDFVDIGDELVVRVAGYPVGIGKIMDISFKGNWIVQVKDDLGRYMCTFYLPPNFKDYDTVDGVAHTDDFEYTTADAKQRAEQIKGRDDV